MPRADIRMTDQEIADYLRAGRTMTLVTLGPDGMPDPVGMWYVVDDDGTVRMRTYAKSQKALNLGRDPRFAALLESGDTYDTLRGVQLSGRVELSREADQVLDVVEGLARKYQGVPSIDRAAMADYASKQVAMTLRVERVVSWDHAKL